jgi:hypothetical protein
MYALLYIYRNRLSSVTAQTRNPSVNRTFGRWTLRDKAAQRRLALR